MVVRALRCALCAAALLAVYVAQDSGRLTLHAAFVANLVLVPLLAAALLAPGRGFWPRRIFEGRAELTLFLAILAVGAAARGGGLTSFPPADGQLWEETQTGKVALESIRYGSLDPYFPAVNLLGELGFRSFGVSLLGLRLPFVGIAVASVALFFIAARLLLRGAPAALLITLLFATNAFLAGCSRVALETMSPIFTECLALAAAFYAATRRSMAGFAFAGFAAGLLSLEYFSYKLLPPLLFLFVALSLLEVPGGTFCNRHTARHRWSALGAHSGQLIVFVLFALAAMAPVLISDPTRAYEFFIEGWKRQQAGIASETHGASLWHALELARERVAASASFVFTRGGNNDLLPDSRGILDFGTGIVGLAAVGYCALFARRSAAKSFLAATTILIVVLAGALVGNPARYRLAPLVPIYLLAIGVLVDDALHAPQATRRFLVLVVAGTLAVSFANLYGLALAARDRGVREEFYDLNLLLANEIARLQAADPRATIYLVSDRDFLGNSNDYEFLYDRRRLRVIPLPQAVGADATHVVAHDGFAAQLQALRDVPLADCRSWRAELGNSTLLSCRVERGLSR